MSKQKFLLSLRPVDTYFFGGERTFGQAKKEMQKKERAALRSLKDTSYLAISNPYPQQTTLLGLLRYLLLQQNGALPLHQNRTKANVLIGPKSFQPDGELEQDFGTIEQLSPLLIQKDQQLYRFSNLLEKSLAHSETETVESIAANGFQLQIPKLEGFNPKETSALQLINPEGQTQGMSNVMESVERIGITKGAENEGFYKQKSFRLKDDFAFAVIVTLETSFQHQGLQQTTLADTVVPFGAEQRPFLVRMQPTETSLETLFPCHEDGRKIILLSDALVDNKIYRHCDFAITDTQDFRSTVVDVQSGSFSKSSVKYNLLKRGSCLLVKSGQLKVVEALLQAPHHFRKIGFNHYLKQHH